MKWQEVYKRKLISAKEAAGLVKSGMTVAFSHPNQPESICGALAERQNELENVNLIAFWTGHHAWHDEPMSAFNVIEAFGFKHSSRRGVQEKWIQYLPYVPGLTNGIREAECNRGRVNSFADIAFVTLTTPNQDGYSSYGRSVLFMPTMLETARIKIGLIDPNDIWTCGEKANLADLDYLVELPLLNRMEAPNPRPLAPSDEEKLADNIGARIAALIPDGSTLQVGTGTASEGVLKHLFQKNDLGFDTESCYTGHLDLIKAGVVTGRNKNINQGKVVTSGLIVHTGNPRVREASEFVHRNDLFEFMRWSRLCNVPRIASNDNLVTVNTLLSIDLLGQAVITHLGTDPITTPGGQLEYTLGAHYSKGGRAIQGLLSTAKGGTVSRIVPTIQPGTAVTLPLFYIDHLVTEHGAVNLNNKTSRERAELIASVAHPKFRDELRDAAKRMFYP